MEGFLEMEHLGTETMQRLHFCFNLLLKAFQVLAYFPIEGCL